MDKITVAEATAAKSNAECFLHEYLEKFIAKTTLGVSSIVVIPDPNDPCKLKNVILNVTL